MQKDPHIVFYNVEKACDNVPFSILIISISILVY